MNERTGKTHIAETITPIKMAPKVPSSGRSEVSKSMKDTLKSLSNEVCYPSNLVAFIRGWLPSASLHRVYESTVSVVALPGRRRIID